MEKTENGTKMADSDVNFGVWGAEVVVEVELMGRFSEIGEKWGGGRGAVGVAVQVVR